MSLQDLPSIYQEELETRLSKVKPRLGEKGTEEELKGIGQVLSLLELEARALRNPQRREKLLGSCQAMRKELAQLTEESQRKALLARPPPPAGNMEGRSSRGNSLGGGEPGGGGGGGDEVEAQRKTLGKGRETLLKTRQTLNETIKVAEGTIQELDDQENTLKGISNKVSTTNMLAGKARTVLRGMEQGELRSKVIQYGAVVFVVVALIVAMYFVLFGK